MSQYNWQKKNNNTTRIITDLLTSISGDMDKQTFLNQISLVDLKLSENNQDKNLSGIIYDYGQDYKIKKSIPLKIPKMNSLTDSLLRSTLGCQQKLAKSYLQILDQSTITQQKQRQIRIQQAKKKFHQANSHKDFYANSKSFLLDNRLINSRPVIQNQYSGYLKTQLIFLEKPNKKQSLSLNNKNKQYYDKHMDVVTKKIAQLGGMEDTVSKMEDSLSKNQLKNLKKRQLIKQSLTKIQQNPFLQKNNSGIKISSGYFQRSKEIRQTIKNKLNIY